MSAMGKILVSACLMGEPVRYDGRCLNDLPPWPAAWRKGECLLPFCPEAAGGLSVPRPPAEIVGGTGKDVLDGGGTVVDRDGRDLTAHFLDGARAALKMARGHGVSLAILKQRSPSCGSVSVYDGRFSGILRPGQGVTAALLTRHGITVFDETQLAPALRFLDGLDPAAFGR